MAIWRLHRLLPSLLDRVCSMVKSSIVPPWILPLAEPARRAKNSTQYSRSEVTTLSRFEPRVVACSVCRVGALSTPLDCDAVQEGHFIRPKPRVEKDRGKTASRSRIENNSHTHTRACRTGPWKFLNHAMWEFACVGKFCQNHQMNPFFFFFCLGSFIDRILFWDGIVWLRYCK